MAPNPKNPPSFKDALVDASQAIAGGVGSPDYDPKFAGMMLDVIGKFIQSGNQHGQQGQPPQPGAPTPPGAAASDGSPGGGPPDGGGPPPGVSAPTGSAGGSPINSQQMNQSGPGAPTMGGLSKGLSPSPDELRRVLADVAGK